MSRFVIRRSFLSDHFFCARNYSNNNWVIFNSLQMILQKLCHFIDNNNIRWILSVFLLKINESFLFLLFIKLLLIVKRLIIEAMHCFFLTCCWFGFLISRSIKIIVFHLFRKNIFPSFFPKISINKIDYFYFVKKSFRLKREFVSVVYFLFVLLVSWGEVLI